MLRSSNSSASLNFRILRLLLDIELVCITPHEDPGTNVVGLGRGKRALTL